MPLRVLMKAVLTRMAFLEKIDSIGLFEGRTARLSGGALVEGTGS